MKNVIKIKGKLLFNPVNKTKKHEKQSSWKKMAMVMLDGDICEYYAWFIEKRYSIKLNKPLRGAHISFINDSITDIMKGLNMSEKEANKAWDKVVKLFDGEDIEISLDISPRSDAHHWWLNIPQYNRGDIHNIRRLVGLGRPHYGLHMSLGFANEKNEAHSQYILRLIEKGFVD